MLIFGPAASAAGSDRLRVRFADGESPSAGEVLAALAREHPDVGFALGGARLAVNQAFAAAETRIVAGDEVALIALVGGG